MSSTEYYNPTTGIFKLGPPMPENNIHGHCTALGPSGIIYLVYGKRPNVELIYAFDPSSRTFMKLVEYTINSDNTDNGKLTQMGCGVFTEPETGVEQILTAGGTL